MKNNMVWGYKIRRLIASNRATYIWVAHTKFEIDKVLREYSRKNNYLFLGLISASQWMFIHWAYVFVMPLNLYKEHLTLLCYSYLPLSAMQTLVLQVGLCWRLQALTPCGFILIQRPVVRNNIYQAVVQGHCCPYSILDRLNVTLGLNQAITWLWTWCIVLIPCRAPFSRSVP